MKKRSFNKHEILFFNADVFYLYLETREHQQFLSLRFFCYFPAVKPSSRNMINFGKMLEKKANHRDGFYFPRSHVLNPSSNGIKFFESTSINNATAEIKFP